MGKPTNGAGRSLLQARPQWNYEVLLFSDFPRASTEWFCLLGQPGFRLCLLLIGIEARQWHQGRGLGIDAHKVPIVVVKLTHEEHLIPHELAATLRH